MELNKDAYWLVRRAQLLLTRLQGIEEGHESASSSSSSSLSASEDEASDALLPPSSRISQLSTEAINKEIQELLPKIRAFGNDPATAVKN